jgi:predicted phage terminase large subunit-like protein
MIATSSIIPEAVREAAAEELARRELLAFAAGVFPGWQNAAHLDLIAGLLERVERGELKRLIVNVPPRHGKTLLCSSIFPAWYLGRHPRKNIIMATHSADLSERNSRQARALVQDDRWPFDSKLSGDSTSASRWNLDRGGGAFATGVGGSVTGRGADILICDDLLHDSLGSDGEKEAAFRWFTEVAVPRLEPGGAIILIGTKFAEDDVFGRVLEGPDADQWTVVRLPALAEESDPLEREIGQALWPARMDVAELEARKREMGTRAYECQFQQNPIPLEGNLIRREWLQYVDQPPTEFTKVVCALDAAAKTGVANDYSAIVKIGVTKNGYYVLSADHFKVEFPALLRRVAALGDEDPKPSTIYVEDASNATALIQAFKAETRIPIVPVVAKGSKISRVEGITGILEAKKVFLPKDAPWLLDFERELLSFPAGKHDDMVDAFTLALSQVSNKKLQGWWFTFGGNGPDEYYYSPEDHSPCAEEAVPTMGSVAGALTRLGL